MRLYYFAFLFLFQNLSLAQVGTDFELLYDSIAPTMLSVRMDKVPKSHYEWWLNDQMIAEDSSPDFFIQSSGRYNLKLIVGEGTRRDSLEKEFFIYAPSKCRFIMQTSAGNMVLELYEETPQHLQNFIDLITKGYYNEVIFHRVIQGFMIQAGEPAGLRLKKALIKAEIDSRFSHVKGALAAARTADQVNPEKKSSATQFYIVHGRSVSEEDLLNYASEKLIDYTEEQLDAYMKYGGAPQLDMQYTVFGRLIQGFDVLDKIAASPTDSTDRPLEDVKILDINMVD